MKIADLARRVRDVPFGIGLVSFFEEIGIGAAVLDRSLRFIAANAPLAEICALPADGFVGQTLQERFPLLHPMMHDRFLDVLATGKASIEREAAGPVEGDPARRGAWLETVIPLGSEDGIEAILVLIKDISERVAARDAMRAAQHQMRHALAAARAGRFAYIAARRVVVMSGRPWDCHSGFADDREIPLADILATVHPDDVEQVRVALSTPGDGGEIACEYRYTRTDGTLHWYGLRGTRDFDDDGNFIGSVGILIGIDEVKEREAAIVAAKGLAERSALEAAEREAELTLALRAAKAGRFRYDIVRRTVQYEAEVRTPFDMPQGDSEIPLDVALETVVRPEDRERMRAAILRTADAAHAGEEFAIEYGTDHPQLGERWMGALGRVVPDAEGRPAFLFGVHVDMTEMRAKERERAALAERVAERENQLRYMLNAAKAAPVAYDFATRQTHIGDFDREGAADPRRGETISFEEAISRVEESHRDEFRAFWERRAAGGPGPVDLEYRGTSPLDDGPRWWRLVGRVQKTGDAPGAFYGVAIDVDESRRNREELSRLNESLKERERQLRLALRAADAGWFRVDVSTGMASFSRVETTPDGETGEISLAALVEAVHADDRPKLEEAWARLNAHPEGEIAIDFRMAVRGEERRIGLRGGIMPDAAGGGRIISGIHIDITRMKRADMERRQLLRAAATREAEMEMAFDTTRSGAFRHDFRTLVSNPSRSLRTLYALPDEPETIYHHMWFERMHPDDRAWVEQGLGAAVQRQDPVYSADYRIFHPSFGVRWISGRIQITYDETGAPISATGIHFDTTEQRERELHLGLALDSIGGGHFTHDAASGRTTASASLHDLLGIPLDVLITPRPWSAVVHPDDLPQVRDAVSNSLRLALGHLDQEYRIIHPERGERWIEDRRVHLYDRDGRHVRTLGILFDVTEKRARQARIEAQGRLLSSALDAAAAMVVTYDYSAGILSLEHVPERWQANLPGDTIAMRIEDVMPLVHPEDRSAIREMVAGGDLSSTDEVSSTIRLDPAYGTVWMSLKGRVERDEAGRRTVFVGFVLDITRQRMAEVALMDASRLALIGELATGVAHEIRQPLNAIKLAARNLQRQATAPAGLEAEGVATRLDRIMRNVERADRVIDALRTLSRAPNGEKTAFDLATALGELVLLQGDVVREAGVDLAVELADGLRARGEAHRLEQAVLNLLVNAIHAVSAAKERRDRHIRLELRAAGPDHAEIVVSDNGGGIPAETMPHIFKPFVTTKTASQGMGLGLSIVHTIVAKEFGGTIQAENVEGGARFRLRLPLDRSGRT